MNRPVAAAPPSKELAVLNARIVEAAVVVTIAAAMVFALVFRLRAGLEDPPLVVLWMLLNSLPPIWLTALATCAFAASETKQRAFLSAAMTLSLSLPVLGLVLNRYISIVSAIILLSIFVKLRVHVGLLSLHRLWRIGLMSAALALLLIVSGVPARLLLPEAMTLGLAHTDSLFHMALAQMIALHHLPSIGADGLLLEHYHVASHAVAAGLSKATGASVALVYTYWGALSLKYQLLWVVFLSGLLLSADSAKDSRIRIFPRIAYSMLVLIASSSLESESFLFALSIYMGLVPLLCSLIEEKTEPPDFRFGLALSLVTSVVCGAAKVSVGFYCAVALLWIAWRHRRSYAALGQTALGLSALATVTVLFLVPTDLSSTSEGLAVVVMSYVEYLNWTTLLSYALPILIIALAITQPRFSRTWVPERARWLFSVALEPLGPRLGSWSAGWHSLLELDASAQLLALSFAACVLVLIMVPIGSNMAYFSVVLLVAGGAVLPATLLRVSDIEISNSPVSAWLLGAVCAAALACAQQFATAGAHTVSALFRAAWTVPAKPGIAADAAAEHRSGGLGGRQIAASIRETGTFFGSLHRQIESLPWSALIRDLRERSEVEGGLVVHVLPTADDFWRRLAVGSPYWCMAAQLMIPAEAGIIEIRSIGPKAIERECAPKGLVWYGFGKNQDLHRTGDLSVEQLCEAASEVHAGRIYMLASIDQPSKNEVVDCKPR